MRANQWARRRDEQRDEMRFSPDCSPNLNRTSPFTLGGLDVVMLGALSTAVPQCRRSQQSVCLRLRWRVGEASGSLCNFFCRRLNGPFLVCYMRRATGPVSHGGCYLGGLIPGRQKAVSLGHGAIFKPRSRVSSEVHHFRYTRTPKKILEAQGKGPRTTLRVRPCALAKSAQKDHEMRLHAAVELNRVSW